jgi:hypothetical protein
MTVPPIPATEALFAFAPWPPKLSRSKGGTIPVDAGAGNRPVCDNLGAQVRKRQWKLKLATATVIVGGRCKQLHCSFLWQVEDRRPILADYDSPKFS